MPPLYVAFAIPVVFTGLGAALAVNAMMLRLKASAAARWPIASGRVLEGGIATMIEEDEDNSKNASEFSTYDVLYSYVVGGR